MRRLSGMLSRFDTMPNIHKIAVLRSNAIGDFTFALPALEALRAAYPAAEIVLLGQEWHARFLEGRPGPVDRAVVVPPYRGVSLPDTGPETRSPGETGETGETPASLHT